MENYKNSVSILHDVTGIIDVEEIPEKREVVCLALSFQPLKEILGLKLEFFTSCSLFDDSGRGYGIVHTLKLFY